MLMLDFLMDDAEKKKMELERRYIENIATKFITLYEMINERIEYENIFLFRIRVLKLLTEFESEIVDLQGLYDKMSSEFGQLEEMQRKLSAIIQPIDQATDDNSVPYGSIPINLAEIKEMIKELSGRVGYALPYNFRSSFTETLDKIVSRLEIITQNSVK